MLDGTVRVAISAFLHDLGELAERARIEASVNDVDGNKNTYCPKTPFGASSYFKPSTQNKLFEQVSDFHVNFKEWNRRALTFFKKLFGFGSVR